MPDVVYDADMEIGGRAYADKAAAARVQYAALKQEYDRRYGKAKPQAGEDRLLVRAMNEAKSVFDSSQEIARNKQMARNAKAAIGQGFAIEVPSNYLIPEEVMDAAVASSGSKMQFQLATKDVVDVFDRDGYVQFLDGVIFSGHTMMRGNDRPMKGTVIKTGKGYGIAVTGDELNKASESSARVAGVYRVAGESKDFVRQIVGGEAVRVDGSERNKLFDPRQTYYMLDVAEDAVRLIDPPEFVRISKTIRPEDKAGIRKQLNDKAGPKIDFAARNDPQALFGASVALKQESAKGWPWVQRPDDEAAAYQNPSITDRNGNEWTVVFEDITEPGSSGYGKRTGVFRYSLELNRVPVASIESPTFDPKRLLDAQVDELFSKVNPDWFYVAKQPK